MLFDHCITEFKGWDIRWLHMVAHASDMVGWFRTERPDYLVILVSNYVGMYFLGPSILVLMFSPQCI
uniref:Sucrose-phosphatase 2-like isoform X2 n=1 Tax=Rhizophora mucronata TaxID=61149 RepID=A0A2P2JEZ5_RHIMU